jgi:hypothetical protein
MAAFVKILLDWQPWQNIIELLRIFIAMAAKINKKNHR